LSEVSEKLLLTKNARDEMRTTSTKAKNCALELIRESLLDNLDTIVQENEIDLQNGMEAGLSRALLDRLKLDAKRIKGIAGGLDEVRALPDPIGEVIETKRTDNGLEIQKVRIPLGVIGMIYESRPNVTVDAAGLAIKSGNCILLRGGEEADHSNVILAKCIKDAIKISELPKGCVDLIETLDRAAVGEMLTANGFIDVLIPRGGHGLISRVVREATVPVIQTGEGNCHVYVDVNADFDMALAIIENGKVQRPSVCNAIEKVLIHRNIAHDFIPKLVEMLNRNLVLVKGCAETKKVCPDVAIATAEDWDTEYLALIIALKVVTDWKEAVQHINQHGTKHSEVIVTNDYRTSRRFVHSVDAAAAYVNASSRFTDGQQFGLGAEIGISTQNLHVRGPMGLRELTTNKFIVYGDGQTRE
jgi:glutamate-5-semialdehyde dehydrogenase